jgi:hypothetical protein
LYTNAQTFYSPIVEAGNIIVPGLYTNDQTFYGPTVATNNTLACEDYVDPGYVDPDWYVAWSAFNTNVFFTPTVTSISTYPAPSDVRLGVVYGPGGIYTGTYAPVGRTTIYVFDD